MHTTLDALYPGENRAAQLDRFRHFRRELAQKAKSLGLRLELKANASKHRPPEAAQIWFEGEGAAREAAATLLQADLATLPATVTPQKAVSQGRRTIRYFISYAHADETEARRLLELLQLQFGGAKHYEFLPWIDSNILPGEAWRDQIKAAIAQCDFGLLLVSPAFLASRFITEEELPHFVPSSPDAVTPGKLAIPVGLKKISFANHDAKGLDARQIFFQDGKTFHERGGPQRDAFAHQLFEAICRRLARPDPQPDPAPRRDAWRQPGLEAKLDGLSFTEGRALPGSFNKEGKPEARAEGDAPRGVMELLKAWAAPEQTQQRYCALLGEYGMGKTTTSLKLAQELAAEHAKDPSRPQPLYFDLRLLGEMAQREPSLPAILERLLEKHWRSGAAEPGLTGAEVMRLVQREGAIALFDGLDEVLIGLTPPQGQAFTRELLRILPPSLWKPQDGARAGKVLLTCRDHYFRSLREQQTHFTGEDRDAITHDLWRCYILLPFEEEQIRQYLGAALPGQDVEAVIGLMQSVHNLMEAGGRPYTLKLIADNIETIEAMRAQGQRVTGATLYEMMVVRALERDDGKHRIPPEYKPDIMRHFAASLWRSGARGWDAKKAEAWLLEFLDAHPEIARHLRDQKLHAIKNDLHTATFLVREGRDLFRFAHTSLQEYFLAQYLLDALRAGRPEDWAMPEPSRETLDFLGQMIAPGDAAALRGLALLRDAYRPQASENALTYALLAMERGHPHVPLAGVRLEGADLSRMTFEGAEDGPLLNLAGACLRGAALRQTVFRRANLEEADLTGAEALRAEFLDCRMNLARLAQAGLEGAVFLGTPTEEVDFRGARFARTRLFDGPALAAPPASFTRGAAPPPREARPEWHAGHDGPVLACAFAPDGTRLASAGDDGTLRIWDVRSGSRLLTLHGHLDWVLACAFAPDGTRLASAGSGGTLRIWDAHSGVALLTLRGNEGMARGCAFAPDGTRLASAGDDGTLRIWDAQSGGELLTLRGHEDGVLACAFAPDGTRLASAGHDGTLQIWDAQSGAELLTLRGHEGSVQACAFAPDGTRLASTGWDGTLRIWDTQSGAELLTLRGHEGMVRACAFAPDGTRLASAGDDGSLRIWDARSGAELLTLYAHEAEVNACGFSPDGTRLASGGDDGTLRIWDAQSGTELLTLRRYQDPVLACAFAPDGTRLASATEYGTLRIYDAQSGAELLNLSGHLDWVRACGFAPDGARIAFSGWDGTLRIWDAHSGAELLTLHEHEGGVIACAFAPDGSRLASVSADGTLRIWDAHSGTDLLTLHGHQRGVRGCVFAPDGTRLASGGGDGALRIWDAHSGAELLTLRGHQGSVLACAFAPDGAAVASAGTDGTLRIWDAQSGTELLTLRGHQGAVAACTFAPDETRLASAGHDGTLRTWNAHSGAELLTLRGHQGSVLACAFAPDGTRLASAGHDGTLRIWDVQSGAELLTLHSAGEASAAFAQGRLTAWSGEAWRHLVWQVPGEDGALQTWPFESFTPP
nr:TIR domain-containing protein [Roseococcus sp. SDR]